MAHPGFTRGLTAAAPAVLPLASFAGAPAQAAEEGSSPAPDPFTALWDVAWTDYDLDGLTNQVEEQNRINPLLTDADGDGLPDGEEVRGGPHGHPWWRTVITWRNFQSSDLDRLPDIEEHERCLSAADGDTDHDELDDWTESFVTLTSPHLANPDGKRTASEPDVSANSDRDGLPDYYETVPCESDPFHTGPTRSDPQTPDTDGDGLSDKEELGRGTDPWAADTDRDGLLDSAEGMYRVQTPEWFAWIGKTVQIYANPHDPDQNRDGIPDGIDFGDLQLER